MTSSTFGFILNSISQPDSTAESQKRNPLAPKGGSAGASFVKSPSFQSTPV